MTSAVSTREAAPTPELDVSNLSNVERLIFAQAVHEFGSGAWQEVAKLLSKHPLISQPKTVFTPQSCSALYKHLMDEASLEWTETETAPRLERHLRLAQRYYVARVTELRGLIAEEEAKFKKLVAEIDEIRSGEWDDKIVTSLGVVPGQPEGNEVQAASAVAREPGAQLPPEPEPRPEAEPEVEQPAQKMVTHEVEQAASVAQTRDEVPVLNEEMEMNVQEIVGEPDMVAHTTRFDAEAETEEKEEGSDNEAVNELIDDFGSDRPMADTVDGPELPTAQVEPVIAREEDMQVDEASVKQEEQAKEPVVEATLAGEPLAEELLAELAKASPSNQPIAEEPAAVGLSTLAEEERIVELPAVELLAGELPTEGPTNRHTDDRVEESTVSSGTEAQGAQTPTELASERSIGEGKRKVSDIDNVMLDGQRERKRPREESEPVDEEEGVPKVRRRGGDTHAVSKRFQNMIGMLHSQISQHRFGNIFHNPIKKSEAPDYHDIVKRPIDLKTIKSRVKDGLISNSLEFQRDIHLMFANAMMYNRPGSEIFNMAEEMMIASEREITAFRQTEGFHRM